VEESGIGVVAVIVTVFAIVVLAIGSYYFYLETSGARRFTVSAKANPDNTITLTISLAGGYVLYIDDISVMASDSTDTMITATLSPSSGQLSVGSTCTATYTYGASASGKVITVKIIHAPGKYVYFTSSSILVH